VAWHRSVTLGPWAQPIEQRAVAFGLRVGCGQQLVAMVRLWVGRERMNETLQALCFAAGANSMLLPASRR